MAVAFNNLQPKEKIESYTEEKENKTSSLQQQSGNKYFAHSINLLAGGTYLMPIFSNVCFQFWILKQISEN